MGDKSLLSSVTYLLKMMLKTLLLFPLLMVVTAVKLDCPSGVVTNTQCNDNQCTATCDDGTQVSLTCESNGVSIIQTNGVTDVQCGSGNVGGNNKINFGVTFPTCFPFCD